MERPSILNLLAQEHLTSVGYIRATVTLMALIRVIRQIKEPDNTAYLLLSKLMRESEEVIVKFHQVVFVK